MNKSVSRYVSLIILFCLTLSGCRSQDLVQDKTNISSETSYVLKGNYDLVKIDNLGNIYLLKNGNQFLKYSQEGELMFQFSIRGLGLITNVDISNPQKILLYYPDYKNIIFVDNTLSEINRLNLEEMGFWDIQGVAVSRDNNIWIHDPINNRLLKVNAAGDIKLSSNETFNNFETNTDHSRVFEYDDRVFLYDDEIIYEFDNFGEFIKSYSIENQGIQFAKNAMYYLSGDSIFSSSYKLHFDIEDQIQKLYTGKGIIDFAIKKDGIWILDNGGLQVVR